MFLKLLILSIIVVCVSLLGFGVQTFFSKKKAFPELSIGKNKELRKKNIYCIKTRQKLTDKNLYKKDKDDISCSDC